MRLDVLFQCLGALGIAPAEFFARTDARKANAPVHPRAGMSEARVGAGGVTLGASAARGGGPITLSSGEVVVPLMDLDQIFTAMEELRAAGVPEEDVWGAAVRAALLAEGWNVTTEEPDCEAAGREALEAGREATEGLRQAIERAEQSSEPEYYIPVDAFTDPRYEGWHEALAKLRRHGMEGSDLATAWRTFLIRGGFPELRLPQILSKARAVVREAMGAPRDTGYIPFGPAAADALQEMFGADAVRVALVLITGRGWTQYGEVVR